MSAVRIAPAPSPAPHPKTRLEVFISYAEEDALLVRDVKEVLSKPFAFLLNFFVDNEVIKDGDDWRKKINEQLDAADVLLIISTGQRRESHDFCGYEVGYFSRSIKERPTIDGIINRQIIPLIIGARPPSSVMNIQGVIIREEDIFNFDLVPGDLSSEEKFLEKIRENNPFTKLLRHLRDTLADMSQIRLQDDDLRRMDQSINECTTQLYKTIFGYLRGRVFTEDSPERKLVVRTALPPLPGDQDSLMAGSTIEFGGQSFDLFGLPKFPPPLKWPAFISQINRAEIATQWREGISNLVFSSVNGVPPDNYYFVSSLRADRLFRLFVSRSITYYSGQKEVHIYIVQRAPIKEYGDTKTTKLLKAISVGARYRSLFLERTSPFSPRLMAYSFGKDLRSAVANLWDELQQLLFEAHQSKLDDPELLAAIYDDQPHDEMDDIARVWFAAQKKLNDVAHQITAVEDDKVAACRPAFMAALTEFCEQTEQMNRTFTAGALRALDKEIGRKFANAPASGGH